MATKRTLTEAETLEQYRVALQNVEDQATITTTMAEFGYDATKIAEGKTLLGETLQAYNTNKIEDDQSIEAYSNFSNLKNQLENTYRLHRKKAKVIYRNDSITLNKLAITGSMPSAYIKRLEIIKKFYNEAQSDTTIQTALATLKLTLDDLTTATTLIANLEATRATYLKEKGESQDATKTKDQALTNMDEWMRDFYAVAKIALDDNPQLLESLNKFVRS